MKTRILGFILIVAIAFMVLWAASIGRYDLAAIVALGNVPTAGMLIYKLWRKVP